MICTVSDKCTQNSNSSHQNQIHHTKIQVRPTTHQARSKAFVSGVAKLPQRNHVVQNLRAYFVIKLSLSKIIMCVQEKNEVFNMSQRPMFSSIKISGDLSFDIKKKQQRKLQKISQGGKKLASCYPGVAFATPCHPMATGLPHTKFKLNKFITPNFNSSYQIQIHHTRFKFDTPNSNSSQMGHLNVP